jgi:heat shock protein HslJ
MRRPVAIAAACALALLLASCAGPKDEGGPDPGLRGEWELQSATDAGGTIPLANQLITLTIDGDNSTTGRSTCSDYTAHVYGSVATLWVTATLPAVENCGIQAQLDIERRYISDLNQVRTSTVSGGVLHLLAPGIDLQYQKALAVPLNLVVDRTWKLATVAPDSYYATSNPTLEPETGATLRFSSKGTLTGETACSTFTARYTQNAGEIVVSDLDKNRAVSTNGKYECIGERQTADVHVLDVLNSGFTFQSGPSDLKISSPRAELTLGFVG